jgi:large subunit ribosomal protein L14
MIQTLSNLKIIDNSGGRLGHCIKVLKNQRWSSLGDVVVVSLRKLNKISKKKTISKKVSLGKVYRLLILQTKKEVERFDGSSVKFSHNAGILLSRQQQPIGSRIKGSFPNELREIDCLKTMSLGPNMI